MTPINYVDPTGHKAKTFQQYFKKMTGGNIVSRSSNIIKVKLRGNKVTVNAPIHFVCNSSTMERKIILNGINNLWTGTVSIAGYKVSVKTSVKESNSRHGAHTINYNKKSKAASSTVAHHKWRINESHHVNLRGGTASLGVTAAHEFGHLLGIDDLYLYSGLGDISRYCIMNASNQSRGAEMSPQSVLLFLKAFRFRKAQAFSNFGLEKNKSKWWQFWK